MATPTRAAPTAVGTAALRAIAGSGWLPAVLLLGLIAGRRWWQQGALPTGLDGGQWLALGRGLVGHGRSTTGAYPPLVPALVLAGETVAAPTTVLRLVAVGSLLAVLVAIYLVARDGLGPWFGLAATATVGPATALTEPAAFGGYPQQVAFACLLLATWALARYLASGARPWLIGFIVALSAGALAHHIYFPLALVTAAAAWLVWLATRPPRPVLVRRSLGACAGGAVAVVLFLPTALAFRAAGYAPPLGATGLGLVAAFRYGTREAILVWLATVLAGIVALALTVRDRRSPAWQIATALIGTAAVAFVATGEVRLLPPLLVGAMLGLGLGLRRLWGRWQATALARLPIVVAVSLPLLLWLPADGEAIAFYRYYRVVDPSLLAAARAVDAEAGDGLVVVRHDRRGWPIGWWFEGLTEAPIAVGADERWLGFPAERARAELAARFFDQRLTGAQLMALARETGVDLLVFKKWEWIGWQRWLDEPAPPVDVLFDDDEFMVLRVLR